MDRALCSRFLISLKNELHLGSEGLPEGTQFQTVLPVHDARWSASWVWRHLLMSAWGVQERGPPSAVPEPGPSLWLQAQWPVWIQSACSSWGRQNEKFFCREREEITNAFTHPGLLRGQGFLLLLLLLQNQYATFSNGNSVLKKESPTLPQTFCLDLEGKYIQGTEEFSEETFLYNLTS